MFRMLVLFPMMLTMVSQLACASSGASVLRDARSGADVSVVQATNQVAAGDIVIVAEEHGFEPHHINQRDILKNLKARGLKVSVGMEFFTWNQQDQLDGFLRGEISEEELLKQTRWGQGIPFDHYREQVMLPLSAGGHTVGINAPRELARAISQKGLESLTDEQRQMLPQGFQLGHPLYRERFEAIMGEHVSADAMDRYFAAQSLWDETMADRAIDYISKNPDQVLVIIVGDFHVRYFGGLPSVLERRGHRARLVISQLRATGLAPDELQKEVEPHPRYGPRADLVWIAP